MRRAFLFCALVAACLLGANGASATPADDKANTQIDEAINKYYAAADFDKAEEMLLAITQACGDECSGAVFARAWMYMAIVRGGKGDLDGVREALTTAMGYDPGVQLDSAFATPEVRAIYEELVERLESGEGPPPIATTGPFRCYPEIEEVETNRPIPVACENAPTGAILFMHFRHSDGEWQTLEMFREGEFVVATIPCEQTTEPGLLGWFVDTNREVSAPDEAAPLDFEGAEAGTEEAESTATGPSAGSSGVPREIDLVRQSDEPPPAVPGSAPPPKCGERATPDGNAWGEPCEEASECQAGLVCTDGKCESPAACKDDIECPDGTCVAGVCEPEERCVGDQCGGIETPNWIGLHFGVDLAQISGQQVCARTAGLVKSEYSCFFDDTLYTGIPNDARSGEIVNGFTLSTMRILLSFERALTHRFALEVRGGFAFNGGPDDDVRKSSFLPVHAEGRVKVYLVGGYVGKERPKGVNLYLHAGGGLAQVDPSLKVQIVDCPDSTAEGALDQKTCVETPAGFGIPPDTNPQLLEVEVYQRLGAGFATGGAGLMLVPTSSFGIVVNASVMYMFPVSGIVFEPSLGVVTGF